MNAHYFAKLKNSVTQSLSPLAQLDAFVHYRAIIKTGICILGVQQENVQQQNIGEEKIVVREKCKENYDLHTFIPGHRNISELNTVRKNLRYLKLILAIT